MTILTIAIVAGILLASFFFWSILRVGCLADQAMGIHDGEQLYPRLCPGCTKKGRRTVVDWVSWPESSAICFPCMIEDFGTEIANKVAEMQGEW